MELIQQFFLKKEAKLSHSFHLIEFLFPPPGESRVEGRQFRNPFLHFEFTRQHYESFWKVSKKRGVTFRVTSVKQLVVEGY